MHAYETTKELFRDTDTVGVETTTIEGILEALVDRFTLPVVFSALADVCYAKAAHISEAWQDRTTARVWEGYAVKCNKTALSLD